MRPSHELRTTAGHPRSSSGRTAKNLRQVVDVDEPQVKLVIFRLADRLFAFPGSSVREVISTASDVFYVPGMHPSVEGVMNLRGEVLSILQLNGLLQLPESSTRTAGKTALLGQGAGIQTGIRIDELLDVTDVAQSLLKPPMDSLPEHLRPLVSALFDFQGMPVTLLDLDLVLQAWQQQLS